VRVAAPPGQGLALTGPANVDDAYQVFANGTLLGSFGKFPGQGARPGQRPVVYYARPKMFHLPRPQSSGGRSSTGASPATVMLAFRVWMEPLDLVIADPPDVGGLHDAPLLGEASVVQAHYQLVWLALVRSLVSQPIFAALFLLLALLAVSLVLFDRSDKVYRWLAAIFLLTAAQYASSAIGSWTQIASGVMADAIEHLLTPLVLGVWVMVWWVWFRLRRPAWAPKAIVLLTLLAMISVVLGDNFFLFVPHSVGAALHVTVLVIDRLLLLLMVLIVIGGIRRQGREGWLAAPAVLFLVFTYYSPSAWLAAWGVPPAWFPLGAQFTLGDISDIAFVATIFVLLLRRLMLSMRHQREMALDMKHAAEVQHVLIPNDLPQIPGLVIESEYRPASEVGGDFFQIIPHPANGSALIVVGDVTGHGLQAGMLVALIVGVIRNEAAHASDPLEMLNALNRALCGRGHAHATCLALYIEADGAATLANAGHLPPYLNGQELPMEGSLPIGMVGGAEFPVMRFEIVPGDTLLLLSDGVAEARDKNGRLFGFDRIQTMLQKPVTAAEVATAAQNFGQDDDISVLRIIRVAVAVEQGSVEPVLAMG